MDPTTPRKRPHGDVLIAGAGGYLGRSIVRACVASGYPVRGLVRTQAGAEAVRAAGGMPVIGDILDREGVRRALDGCGSAIHVAATYPEAPADAERARRVRVDGARNLVAGARAAGVRRLLIGSGYWVYSDQPGTLSDDSPLDPRGESKVNRETEEIGLQANEPGNLDVEVVRPGMVYGDGSWFRGMVDSIRSGQYQVPESGRNRWSLVEREDTAAAFRTILESGHGGESYLVVDDAPISLGDLVALIAHETGATPPGRLSRDALELSVGKDVAHHLTANRAGSNRKMRALGWVPKYPDCRTGVPMVLRTMKGAPSV